MDNIKTKVIFNRKGTANKTNKRGPISSEYPLGCASAIILFNGIFALGLGLAIASIAESTLYQKQKQQVADLMEE